MDEKCEFDKEIFKRVFDLFCIEKPDTINILNQMNNELRTTRSVRGGGSHKIMYGGRVPRAFAHVLVIIGFCILYGYIYKDMIWTTEATRNYYLEGITAFREGRCQKIESFAARLLTPLLNSYTEHPVCRATNDLIQFVTVTLFKNAEVRNAIIRDIMNNTILIHTHYTSYVNLIDNILNGRITEHIRNTTERLELVDVYNRDGTRATERTPDGFIITKKAYVMTRGRGHKNKRKNTRKYKK